MPVCSHLSGLTSDSCQRDGLTLPWKSRCPILPRTATADRRLKPELPITRSCSMKLEKPSQTSPAPSRTRRGRRRTSEAECRAFRLPPFSRSFPAIAPSRSIDALWCSQVQVTSGISCFRTCNSNVSHTAGRTPTKFVTRRHEGAQSRPGLVCKASLLGSGPHRRCLFRCFPFAGV